MRSTGVGALVLLLGALGACGGKLASTGSAFDPEAAGAERSDGIAEVVPYLMPDPGAGESFSGFDTSRATGGACPRTVPAAGAVCSDALGSDYHGAQCEFTVPKGTSSVCHWHCKCVAAPEAAHEIERWSCGGALDCYP